MKTTHPKNDPTPTLSGSSDPYPNKPKSNGFPYQLPVSLMKRIDQLTQQIRTQAGKENTPLLEVYYLALENGLEQMEFLENALIQDDDSEALSRSFSS